MENFEYVLYLFACASKGEKAEIIKDIDIKEINEIAIKHGIWCVVFLAIKEMYEKDKNIFNLNEELYDKLNCYFMQVIYKNIVKWQRLPEIINKVSAANIDVCLLKGLTLGTLYNEPYSRVTSDIDLLIDPQSEKCVCKILESEGFSIMYRWEGSHHTKCIRNDIGLLEIHTQLYDKEVQELWFNANKVQNYTCIDFEYENFACKQLNTTDGLIFVFLHFVKHYISGLLAIKQLMDIMLYIKKNKATIDFDKFNNTISVLNYYELYKTIQCLAVKYLGFTFEDLQENNTLLKYANNADCVLKDINKYAGTDKASVYHIYTRRLSKKRSTIQTKEMTKYKINTICQFVWTNKKRMESLYGEAYERKIFRPFYQLHRIFVRLIDIKKYVNKKDALEKNELTEANDRIILLKKLGVL